ncbi:MAG: (2Fe-2S)-binding protein [bacterium]
MIAAKKLKSRAAGNILALECTVNGEKVRKDVNSGKTLLEFLRNDLRLTGTKEGCGEGECGTCVVLVDGKAVNSCLFMAVQACGREILTIEGLRKKGRLHPLQKAFADEGGVQCGFCTPGMIMSAEALLRKNPAATREEIATGLSGNICRCTGYEKIFKAVEKAGAAIKRR